MRYPAAPMAAALLVAATQPATAQNYDTTSDTAGVRAAVIEAEPAEYPSTVNRTGQEGWVMINFVVDDSGKAIDPVIVDSIGGYAFEVAALDAVDGWRFEPAPAGEEIGNNIIELRSEIYRGRDAATSNFMRRYRRIVTHLVHEETDQARELLNQTAELGGWNLYESAMLCLMAGRVEGQEGDLDGKLKYYRRAIEASNRSTLDGDNRRDALRRVFEAQYALSQLGSAQETLAQLEADPRSQKTLALLKPQIDSLRATLADSADFSARGRLSKPCNCAEGTAVWRYLPARQEFSFAKLDGAVERVEARCDTRRQSHEIRAGERYTLPESDGNCRLYVFGDEQATFDLIEHGESGPGRSSAGR